MLSLETVIENFDEFRTPVLDLFTGSFAFFLTEEQGHQVGLKAKDGCEWPKPIPYTKENILKGLQGTVSRIYMNEEGEFVLRFGIFISLFIISLLHILEDTEFDDTPIPSNEFLEGVIKKYKLNIEL